MNEKKIRQLLNDLSSQDISEDDAFDSIMNVVKLGKHYIFSRKEYEDVLTKTASIAVKLARETRQSEKLKLTERINMAKESPFLFLVRERHNFKNKVKNFLHL